MALVKCPICEERFDREKVDSVKYKTRWYHTECFATVEKETRAKEELHSYICKLFNLKAPGPVNYKYIKRFIEENGYTYEGILNALKYFYEVKEGDIEKAGERIGIVPFVYSEANRYYEQQESIKNKIEQQLETLPQQQQQKPTIVVNTQRTKTKNRTKIYDIEGI